MQKLMAGVLGAAIAVYACPVWAGTLDEVKAKGVLTCGTNPATAGFSVPDNDGKWTGFVVDYCRAVAAGVLGDATKVKFIPLNAKDRFTALQSGEIDILAHNATWTSSRDTSLGIIFAGTYFYDGQGFMVRKSENIQSAKALDGASICVSQGTTAELNLADYFRTNGMTYSAVGFADEEAVIKAYEEGRCDVFSADTSSLNAARIRMAKPDENIVLPEIISKEPLGPAVRQGDDQWLNIAKWTLNVMLAAEEFGVTSKNVDEMKNSGDPNIRRLLGVEGSFGKDVGLGATWSQDIIKQVGNYSEIFERSIGKESPLRIERGVNALWSAGGLQYAPPIR
ncbi:general L-amino acid transport system substrate-binding protein [Rhizobium aethiopicum]|uniref:General L-amino acid transport system substrate-binding protein n=1 Tax=Rhizobium aethiopicum TaxID=1138170 RepID=A0A7W6Q8J1_9HYPH|nr:MULTISPECIES: amino acid ABC transporter substrate-binding protein [Rhizobium]MBB4192603.1 general L-amino acid transport system substrate-binding protein [Rhizobium aethiopicum]MBB4579843.1 general L-amino acid transport system substrate-binding protein [Rhizobium aethiopicum]MDO3435397.1 amino acid ABC transporter substrate-binding protein [Rhizobium sp. CBN3]